MMVTQLLLSWHFRSEDDKKNRKRDGYSCQTVLRTQFKVATVDSIHTQSLSLCSTGLVPNVLPRGMKARVSPMPSLIDYWHQLETRNLGSTVQSSNHYNTTAISLHEFPLKSPAISNLLTQILKFAVYGTMTEIILIVCSMWSSMIRIY